MSVSETPKIFQLLTIRKFCEKYPVITKASIYKAIFHTKTTGIVASGAVLRLNGKWLVDEEAMIRFMRSYARKWAAAKPDPEGERKRPAWATK